MKLMDKFLLAKNLALLALTPLVAELVNWIKKVLPNEWWILLLIGFIVVLDTITGMYKAYMLKTFSSKGLGPFMRKTIEYSIGLFTGLIIDKVTGFPLAFNLLCGFIVLREGLSIFENIAKVSPDRFPVEIRKRLKDFDSLTGKPNEKPDSGTE